MKYSFFNQSRITNIKVQESLIKEEDFCFNLTLILGVDG